MYMYLHLHVNVSYVVKVHASIMSYQAKQCEEYEDCKREECQESVGVDVRVSVLEHLH